MSRHYELYKYDLWMEDEGVWTVNDLIPTCATIECDGLTERKLLEFIRENFDLAYLADKYCYRDPDLEDCEDYEPDNRIDVEVDGWKIDESDEPFNVGEDEDKVLYIDLNGTHLCELRLVSN